MPNESPCWKIGDRIQRESFMDDGTWARLGDACLKDSPMRTGTVVDIEPYCNEYAYQIEWDDGDRIPRLLLGHGMRTAPNTTDSSSVEIRRNDDGSLDEIVGRSVFVHLEQLDVDRWFLDIGGVRLDLFHPRGGHVKAVIFDPPEEVTP